MSSASDQKFLQEKEALVKSLQDIAEYLGDEDAKNVSLNSTSNVQLSQHSANTPDSVSPSPVADEA